MIKGKKILITGGAGFIGSNLAHELSESNEVTVIDNLSTGNIRNLHPLIESRKIEFINGDVTDVHSVKTIAVGKDFLFHEAAIPSVPRSIRNPLLTNHANIGGTLACLIAARDADIGKFIFASSSSVYGDVETLPKREDLSPRPLSPYSLTKATGEQYCRIFRDIYGLDTISLRYFNVYGPRQDSNSEYAAVIPRFILSSLSKSRLPIYGDGQQTRDFTFIRDVVRANILAAESKSSGVHNIASGRRVSIETLAEMISKIIGVESNIEYLPPRDGDIRHSLADISSARKAFGYSPEYSLEQGLKETIIWFQNFNREIINQN